MTRHLLVVWAVATLGCSSTKRDFGKAGDHGDAGSPSGSLGAAGGGAADAAGGDAGAAGDAGASSGGMPNGIGGDAGALTGGSAGNGGSETGGTGGPSPGCSSTERCVPEAPAGWSGPYSSDLDGSAPTCPVEFPALKFQAGAIPTNTPAVCGPCACSGCKGGACTAKIQVFNDQNCMATPASEVDLVSTTPCTTFAGTSNIVLTKVASTASDASSVTCTKTPGTVTRPVPTWQAQARLCGGFAQSRGQCGVSNLCFPALGEPERVCISRAGALSCPAAYPSRQVLYTAFKDTRDCSCTCTPNVTCSDLPQVGISTQLCGGTTMNLGCAGYNSPLYLSLSPPASTTATGSVAPSGTVEPDSALTVCCLP
ncbi:MAG: hypothetical protein ABI548_03135 [Polyangiaceae bacterium]